MKLLKLTEDLSFDFELAFEEQSQEVQDYINEFINTNPPDIKTEEPAGVYPRPLTEIWNIGELKVKNTYNYRYPANHTNNGEHSIERSYL